MLEPVKVREIVDVEHPRAPAPPPETLWPWPADAEPGTVVTLDVDVPTGRAIVGDDLAEFLWTNGIAVNVAVDGDELLRLSTPTGDVDVDELVGLLRRWDRFGPTEAEEG